MCTFEWGIWSIEIPHKTSNERERKSRRRSSYVVGIFSKQKVKNKTLTFLRSAFPSSEVSCILFHFFHMNWLITHVAVPEFGVVLCFVAFFPHIYELIDYSYVYGSVHCMSWLLAAFVCQIWCVYALHKLIFVVFVFVFLSCAFLSVASCEWIGIWYSTYDMIWYDMMVAASTEAGSGI